MVSLAVAKHESGPDTSPALTVEEVYPSAGNPLEDNFVWVFLGRLRSGLGERREEKQKRLLILSVTLPVGMHTVEASNLPAFKEKSVLCP